MRARIQSQTDELLIRDQQCFHPARLPLTDCEFEVTPYLGKRYPISGRSRTLKPGVSPEGGGISTGLTLRNPYTVGMASQGPGSILTLLLATCVAFGQFIYFSEPHVTHL